MSWSFPLVLLLHVLAIWSSPEIALTMVLHPCFLYIQHTGVLHAMHTTYPYLKVPFCVKGVKITVKDRSIYTHNHPWKSCFSQNCVLIFEILVSSWQVYFDARLRCAFLFAIHWSAWNLPLAKIFHNRHTSFQYSRVKSNMYTVSLLNESK